MGKVNWGCEYHQVTPSTYFRNNRLVPIINNKIQSTSVTLRNFLQSTDRKRKIQNEYKIRNYIKL